MKKACLILPFFGKVTHWNNFFFKSLAFNVKFDWLIFSDISFPGKLPLNVRIIRLTLDDFNKIVSNELNFTTNIDHPYKICDFKPAFGYLFSKYIKDYEYWGYCDMDVIFGDLDSFLAEPITLDFDIISPDDSFFPGHFCLCKNHENITNLFLKATNYQKIFSSNKYHYFDEFYHPKGISISKKVLKNRIKKVVKMNRIRYLINTNKSFKILFTLIKKHIKVKSKDEQNLVDFNSLIEYYSRTGRIKVCKNQIYDSDTRQYRLGYKGWCIKWDNGKLINSESKEILYFHFPLTKYNGSLKIEDFSNESDSIFIVEGKF